MVYFYKFLHFVQWELHLIYNYIKQYKISLKRLLITFLIFQKKTMSLYSESSGIRFNDFRGDRRVRGWLWTGLKMFTLEMPLAWILGVAGNTLGKLLI